MFHMVDVTVAGKVVAGTVKVIRAALRDDVNLRPARLSVLRVVRVGDHLELFDGVDAHVVNLRGVRADVEVLGTVEREAGEVLSQTIDLLPVGAEARSRFVAPLIPRDAGHQRDELHVAAAIDGQLLRLFAGDEMRDVGTGGDQGFLPPYFQDFADRADRAADVQSHPRVQLDLQILANEALEAGELGGEGGPTATDAVG